MAFLSGPKQRTISQTETERRTKLLQETELKKSYSESFLVWDAISQSIYRLSQVHTLTLDVAFAACFPVRILYIQMKTQCTRYVATDFHVDRFSSVFENQLSSWSTDFGFLPPSSPISETAEASGVILQLRHTCVSHSAMAK